MTDIEEIEKEIEEITDITSIYNIVKSLELLIKENTSFFLSENMKEKLKGYKKYIEDLVMRFCRLHPRLYKPLINEDDDCINSDILDFIGILENDMISRNIPRDNTDQPIDNTSQHINIQEIEPIGRRVVTSIIDPINGIINIDMTNNVYQHLLKYGSENTIEKTLTTLWRIFNDDKARYEYFASLTSIADDISKILDS